jgi:hypothetical protein
VMSLVSLLTIIFLIKNKKKWFSRFNY